MDITSYNIKILPIGLSGMTALTYSHKVSEHLSWIDRTVSGKLLLKSIKFFNLPIVISPYTGGKCNAVGGGKRVGGKLEGIVNYSPDTFSYHGACPSTRTVQNSGMFWDEVLFHELIHVFRNISGKWNRTPLSFGLNRYTNNEEFYAVLITNIYISDKSNKIKSDLRADHRGFLPLSGDFDDAFEFFSSSSLAFGLIEKFCNDHSFFAKRLAIEVSTAQFNPLSDYYADKERARKLSQGAAVRDIQGLVEHMGRIISNV